MKAIIKESGREVEIEIEDDVFYIKRPYTYSDGAWRNMFYSIPVAGPFPLNDERFIIQ